MAKIKILSHDVTYKLEDPGLWATGLGRAYIVDMVIAVNSNLPEDAKRSTTLHEITHIISDLLQLELTEQQADGVAVGMHSLLKDNKKFMGELYG